MEKQQWYEHKDLRICKHNIQREDCRKCLFETLCRLEDVSNAMDHNVHFIH